jgi:hypothetical protein
MVNRPANLATADAPAGVAFEDGGADARRDLHGSRLVM